MLFNRCPRLVPAALDISKMEQRDIERCFARVLSSEDGQKVLAHLQALTFHRALSANASHEELRYIEGQRGLVATILRLVDRGRNPST